MVPEKNVTEVLSILKIFKVSLNRKSTCGRLKTVLNSIVVCTDPLCQISASFPLWFLRKMWQKFSLYQKYSKFWQTGIGHVTDMKLSYTIQFSILMLCARMWQKLFCHANTRRFRVQQEVKESNRKWTGGRLKTVLHLTVVHTDALCQISGSCLWWFPRKMWQFILWRRHKMTILSSVKQEVDRPYIWNCLTLYTSPYWCSGSWLIWFLRKMWQKFSLFLSI